MQDHAELLAPIRQFLRCETPDSWVKKASEPESLPILLKESSIM